MEFKPALYHLATTTARDDDPSSTDPPSASASSAAAARGKLTPMALARSRSNSSSSGGGSRKIMELQAPSTPGRPFFFSSSCSPAHPAKRPSKWEDADKWLIGGGVADANASCHEKQDKKCSRTKSGVLGQGRRFSTGGDGCHGALVAPVASPLLKDKFPDNNILGELPNFGCCSEAAKESSVLMNPCCEVRRTCAAGGERRDVGTEMSPLGSCTTTRCHTPMKSTSPARHNTPTGGRSGPLAAAGVDISDCHFAKLDLTAQFSSMLINWKSKEEEEEEVSKSLRHFEQSFCEKKSIAECRVSAWEEQDRTKSCIRYQREEAKIQAWVNLESAKAEAQSRKLEVKIQKMRCHLEEKLMRRMASVRKKAEEWRAEARMQHMQQLNKADAAFKASHRHHHGRNCGCFPCNSTSTSTSNSSHHFFNLQT